MTLDTVKLAVSVEEAAERISVGRSQVWEEIAANRLRSFKIGRRRLIAVKDLEAYLERRVLLTQGAPARGRR
jgi:excisionase family DNA binding protein